MANIIVGKGQLKHHFWGDYRATIVVQFGTPDYAQRALAHLPGFTQHPNAPEALVFFGGGRELQQAEAALKAHKADDRKIGSLRHSVDYGEPFTVEIDITPEPAEVQPSLFAEASA